MEYQISRAHRGNFPDIARLIVETRIGKETVKEQMKEGFPMYSWFVRVDGKIVGCMCGEFIDSTTMVLTYLAVNENHRKQGIGMTLFDHAIEFGRKEGKTVFAFITMYYHFRRFKKRGFSVYKRQDLPENVRNHPMFTAKRYMKCAAMIRQF